MPKDNIEEKQGSSMERNLGFRCCDYAMDMRHKVYPV